MKSQQRFSAAKGVLTVVGIVLLLLLVVSVLAQLAFRPIPADAKVQALRTDHLGHRFVLAEDHKLYIGGQNGDRFGFYDTGFRWGLLYGIRNLTREREPVLFAESVTAVFPCEYGLLYTDLSGSLFYFGEQNGGKRVKVAEEVLAASGTESEIVYVTQDHTAYCTSWDSGSSAWKEALRVSEDVSELYDTGETLWLLSRDGHVSTLRMRGSASFSDRESLEVAAEIERMWNGPGLSVLQKKDGIYLLAVQEDSPQVQELKDWNANSTDADQVLADADLKGSYPGDFLLSRQGNVYQIKNGAPVFVRQMQEGLVDFAVHGETLRFYTVDKYGNLLETQEATR